MCCLWWYIGSTLSELILHTIFAGSNPVTPTYMTLDSFQQYFSFCKKGSPSSNLGYTVGQCISVMAARKRESDLS